jgi:hypothetical protein
VHCVRDVFNNVWALKLGLQDKAMQPLYRCMLHRVGSVMAVHRLVPWW